MRLLKFDRTGSLSLTDPLDEAALPPYAVLSHTWSTSGEEVTFQDINTGSGRDKAGYHKILFCGQQALNDGLKHFWVDTCCIDQTNEAELSEAIISMFRWYGKAKRCYVYLTDFSVGDELAWQHDVVRLDAFRKCRWFTRGWCLQELLAPSDVKFYSVERVLLGDKVSLEQYIHEITGIPTTALRGTPLTQFSVTERMSWAKGRETKRKEDRAYCLLGIFGVFMPLLYGEGDHAFKRLEKKIAAKSSPGTGAESNCSENMSLPMSTVPFRRDPDFIDRIGLSQELDEKCGREAAQVALVGIGGVGKSQLAIDYCHRLQNRRPDARVFWIHASSVDRVEQGFRELAEVADLPGCNDPQVNLFELVRKYLRDRSTRPWLVVLDGLDDLKALKLSLRGFSDQSGQDVLDYLPQTSMGAILITTRTMSIALRMVEHGDIIEVTPMTETDASRLLARKLQYQEVTNELGELARILDYMPLALVQAAAFIRQQRGRYTIRRYILKFREGDQSQVKLLDHEAGHLRRDRGALNSIIITLQISFDYIQEQRPTSADLLSLMSFCDEQSIPETLLRPDPRSLVGDALQNGETNRAENTDSSAFDADLELLTDCMLVKVKPGQLNLTMHGLVQLAVRNWLAREGRVEHWRQMFVKNLNNSYPSADFENWAECEALLPHVKRAEEHPPDHTSSSSLILAWAKIMRNAGSYRMVRGQYEEAERLCQSSSEKLEDAFGRKHPETIYSMAKVAEVYRDRGWWAEAENRFLAVLSHASGLMVPESFILAVRIELAKTYNQQARPDDAIILLEPTLETATDKLGPDDALTLKAMACLAVSHWRNANYSQAEQLEVRVLNATTRIHNVEHPDTLMSMANLASTLRDQGRWKDAEKLELEVLQVRERLLGSDHSDTLNSMSSLAVTLWYQGRLEESERLEERVLEGTSKVLGTEHPDTLARMTNLASTYRDQERWNAAEDLLSQVIESSTRASGSRHPHTLNAQINLAATWRDHGRLNQAKDLAAKVLEIHSTDLNAAHPDVLSSMTTLQTILHLQGAYDKSEELGLEVLRTRKETLGDEHPDTLVSMSNLARTYKEQGRHEEALELMSSCKNMSVALLGPEHPQARKVLETLSVWLTPEDDLARMKIPGAWID